MSEENGVEAQIRKLAAAFKYPPTPDMARLAGRGRRLDWKLAMPVAVLLAAVTIVFAVPPVRAALVEVFGIGSVEIVLGEPTPTAEKVVITLPGETTLEFAREASPVPIPLPPDLGIPDRIFVLSQLGNTVVVAWEEEDIALYVIPPGLLVQKLSPENVEQTQVNNRPAIWTTGDHFLELLENDPEQRVFITSHVLIWTDKDVTYRLETDLPLDEAVAIAESLK